MTIKKILAPAILMASLGGASNAAILSADFYASFDLPSIGSGAREFQRLGEPAAGGNEPDLGLVDEISNPSFWGGYATVDLSTTGVVTVEGDQGLETADDYDLFTIVISNIVFDGGESVLGFNLLGDTLITDNSPDGAPAPILAFTANSVSVTYDSSGYGDNADFLIEDFGIASFQIVTAVPLPAALPLMGVALGGLFGLRRRSKA